MTYYIAYNSWAELLNIITIEEVSLAEVSILEYKGIYDDDKNLLVATKSKQLANLFEADEENFKKVYLDHRFFINLSDEDRLGRQFGNELLFPL